MKALALTVSILSLLFSSSALAGDDALLQAHVGKGLSCPACHQESPPGKKVKTPKCQQCHGSYEALAERTAKMTPNNAHANHLGDLDCSECHKVHKKSAVACDECHQFKFSMPK